jgi:hypothetical protein
LAAAELDYSSTALAVTGLRYIIYWGHWDITSEGVGRIKEGRHLVRLKEGVLKKTKEQQKRSCSCVVWAETVGPMRVFDSVFRDARMKEIGRWRRKRGMRKLRVPRRKRER